MRQVHLDFHNSSWIESVADQFDAEQFGDTMAGAHVTSVNVFAKCLHGFSYYPTEVGQPHPGLKRDLLGEQIAALRRRGIKAPVYLSVLWDDWAAQTHPEWVAVDRDGRLLARPPYSNASAIDHALGWSVLDLASGYADHVVDQVEEICSLYEVDGFWFDIVSVIPNHSPAGMARMRSAGVDVGDQQAVLDFYLAVRDNFIGRIERLVHRHAPAATLVYNHTTDAWLARTLAAQNQIDVESLPTDGAWGYLHYPVVSRYARTFGAPVVGMTGRFHRSWSDFGGLKTPDQLAYEVATVLAAGGSPSIGDHLDPSGRLDPAVYAVIGEVYGRAEALEPWLAGARPLTEAAVVAQWDAAAADAGRLTTALIPGVHGAAEMLIEQAVQFDVVDAARLTPGRYDLIVVPDDAELGPGDAAAIELCRRAGAALLTAGARPAAGLGDPPIVQARPIATRPGFFRPGELAAEGSRLAADFAYAAYGQAYAITPAPGAETLGTVVEARFNRTWARFTSHGHSPVGDKAAGPLVAVLGDWAHLATPAFSDYHREGYWPGSAVVRALIDRLAPRRLVRHDGPAWVEAALQAAPAASATVLHLTAYQPRRAAHQTPRLDDAHPLAGFAIRVRTDRPVKRVVTVPDRGAVPHSTLADGTVELRPLTVAPLTVIALEHGDGPPRPARR
ncbi:MAG: alpha-L-fucosidase [Bifidobacteriaceae bacterium]|jgi:hypothetical protein|nr:alpha-L-fucosidase [Bifidobacteriaceae bacterium]